MSRVAILVLFAAVMAFSTAQGQQGLAWKDADDGKIQLTEDGSPVLVYNYDTVSKEGVPSRYDRANYLHPVYGLNGEILTEDFPEDHPHHRGIFWAWPHIRVGGEEYETWKPGSGVTYRHERWVRKRIQENRAVLVTVNGWYADEGRIMDERVKMTISSAAGGRRTIDFEFTWTPTDQPVTLQGRANPKKSYGGFTFRFNTRVREEGGLDTSEVTITTPDGVSGDDLVNERLRWADFTAPFPGAEGQSGAAVFVSDSHPDYPPAWLTRHYGALCVGWPGVQSRTLEPDESVTCRYRVLIHDGKLSPDQLRAAYEKYCGGRDGDGQK